MKNSRLVYSTDQGRIKPNEEKPTIAPSGDGIIRLARETKGRKGKGVTLVSGFELNEKDLKSMSKKLKQLCGVGGTLKDGVIEIQGEQRDKILDYLSKEGYKVKKVGG